MIKDFVFKLIFIPLTGIFIPAISHLIHYQDLTTIQIFISVFLFLITSFLVWQGTISIISRLRNRKSVNKNAFRKVGLLSIIAGLYAAVMACLSSLLWQLISGGGFRYNTILNHSLWYASVFIFVTLIYEVLFLKKELELDTKIVNQLDQERQYAEMNVLKNELDPHFILNSLTALSHLITNDTEKAQLFTQKLAQAYKYLLINKDRDLISLEEELRFIDNYFFLLQIRHDDKLKLHVDIDKDRRVMILPCALQTLIENAIKHNMFTEEDPLNINISLNGAFLIVANNVRSKSYQVESTNIGLKNLSTRYKLTCNKDIIIYSAKEKFIVKLPII